MASVAAVNRVMGQGDQRKLHSFFGQYIPSTNDKSTQASSPLRPSESDHAKDSPKLLHSSPECTTRVAEQSLANGQTESNPNESAFQDVSFDEDPNADRRKRLKTSALLESEIVDRAQDPGTQSTYDVDPPDSRPFPGITSTSLSSSPHVQNSQDSHERTMAEKKSPPRKLLKLNPNGKLLSSPPARRFEEKSHNKPEGKRKSALEKKTKTKVVAIKYIGGNRSKETLGKTIDDILNGALKYVPLRQVVTATNTGPPKPTHPFFVKNAAQKPVQVLPLMSHTSENIGKSDQPHEQRSDIFKPARADSQFSRSIFPKQPDLIASLWPPKDLLHLRDSGPWRSSDDTGSILPGQRKDKESVVRVDDSENILLIELKHSGSSSHGSDTPVLRVPTRYVASGQTFQKGMESQLSQTVRSEFAANGKPSKIHPSVFKFYNLITTSQSALDEGSFDTTQWTQKYAPTNAEEVLQPGPEVRMLRDWLRNLMVSSVDTGKSSTDKQKRLENRKAKRRKAADKLDGFIVSSEDEASEMDELSDPDNDELAGDVTVSSKRTVIRVGDSVGKFQSKEKGRMTNAVLISGPNGCGKSASVYAVAKELDFEVFEVNSGNRRSAKDILERVGDMTQNHLVHHLDSKDEMGEDSNDDIQPAQLGPIDTAKQSTMNSFYKSATQSSSKQGQKKKKNQRKDQRPANSAASTFSRPQKQSLILLEEADILFEEDKQFWTGVLALISQSKRPVIITCSFEELIPLQDLSLHAILRYRPPPVDLAVDYMLVIAANEGHMLDREAVRDLYSVSNHDLRKSLMELDFWCQMGVGSKKCGIDWILDRWPKGSDVDAKGDTLRVISLQTYQRFMGWFNRDILVGNNEFEEEMELQLEGLNWWQLDNDDTDNGNLWEAWVSDNSGNSHVEQASKETSFHKLQRAAELADNQSVIDILSPTWSLRQEEDTLDTSITEISERQRSNYVEGYPLLLADCKPDYTGLSASIGSAANVMMRHSIFDQISTDHEFHYTQRVLKRKTRLKHAEFCSQDFLTALEPITRADYLIPLPTGRVAPSFENSIPAIAKDLAPYIRSIVAFDLRLEKFRLELSGLRSSGSMKRKARTTRASRAALEGGSKNSTRRDRWFSADVHPNRILATGCKEWQEALVQQGHFTVQPCIMSRRVSYQSVSESSAE